ncbi:hypothetical protein GN956_G20004 [Arapaima gigas]
MYIVSPSFSCPPASLYLVNLFHTGLTCSRCCLSQLPWHACMCVGGGVCGVGRMDAGVQACGAEQLAVDFPRGHSRGQPCFFTYLYLTD